MQPTSPARAQPAPASLRHLADGKALPAACLLGILLLFMPPLLYGIQSSHDVLYHLSWFESYRQALREGMLYPRWLPDQMDGMGSPALYFYPPFASFCFAAVDALTMHMLSADRVLAVAALLLALASGASSFVWCRRLLPNAEARTGALLLATLYAIAPYHLLIDLYTRAAFAEYAAYVWVPLIFTALHYYDTRAQARWLALLALCTAALLMTHLLTALMVGPIAAAYAVILPAPSKTAKAIALGRITLAALLGACLAAIYLLPALTLLPWTNSAALLAWPIENSYFRHLFEGGASDQTLKRAFLIALAYLGLAAYFAFEYIAYQRKRTGQPITPVAALWLAIIVGACLAMAGYAGYLFHAPSPYRTLQFAWRLLSMVEFAFISLAALALGTAASTTHCAAHRRISTAILSALVLAFAGQGADIGIKYRPEYRQKYPVMTSTSVLARLSPLEYFPNGSNFPRAPEQMLARLRSYTQLAQTTSAVSDQTGQLSASKNGSVFTLATVSEMPMQVRLRQFYFPGWQASAENGQRVPVAPGGPDRVVMVEIPPGRHQVIVRRVTTTQERIGTAISLAALVVLAGMTVLHLKISTPWTTPRSN